MIARSRGVARAIGELPATCLPLIVCLALTGCRADGGTPAGASRAIAASAGAPPGEPTPLTLSPEARRLAGLETEVVHPRPFTLTLSVVARLSPTAETPEELEARLAYSAAAARERRALQELERSRRLAADQVVAARALENAEADAAEARLARARADAALRNLGLDPEREPATPSADLWALADLYGPQAAQVRPGAAAFVRAESIPGEVFPGRVISLARFLKPDTRTLTARIAVEDPQHRLRPQEIAAVEVAVGGRTALSLPDAAVLYEETRRVVFVARGERFEKVPVDVGAQQGGRTEVVAGLAEGDTVVTRGAQFLLGEMYRIRNPGALGED